MCIRDSDDTLLYIFYVWKRQMLCRRHIAEERSAVHSSHGAAYSGGDMIVAHSDISNERPQHVERSSHADSLLHLHVCCYLIERNMSGTLYHNLYVCLLYTSRCV